MTKVTVFKGNPPPPPLKNRFISVKSITQYAVIASFSLYTSVSYSVPPANDNLADAITITSFPFSHTLTETEAESATSETNEALCTSLGGNLSWWYKITPSSSGNMTIVAGHSDNTLDCDIRLGVYTGSSHPLSQVSCTDSDDGPGANPYGESETIGVTAGTTYYLRLAINSTTSAVDSGAVCKTDVNFVSSTPPTPPVSANFGVGAGLALSLAALGGVAAGIRRRKLRISN